MGALGRTRQRTTRGPTTAEQQHNKDQEREVRELRKTNAILKLISAHFAPGGVRPPTQEMNAFIDEHRARCRVELICRALLVAPSAITCWAFE